MCCMAVKCSGTLNLTMYMCAHELKIFLLILTTGLVVQALADAAREGGLIF